MRSFAQALFSSLLLLVLRTPLLASSFAPISKTQTGRRTLSTSTSQIFADPGGMKRGAVVMVVVLSACVWSFSIPPEFRRAKLCSAEEAATYEQCKTVNQWISGVQEYYQQGGGINFDFSIDPGTLKDNEEFRKAILGD